MHPIWSATGLNVTICCTYTSLSIAVASSFPSFSARPYQYALTMGRWDLKNGPLTRARYRAPALQGFRSVLQCYR